MNLEYKEKYLKYKAKYLELKNDLIGGTIEHVKKILAITTDNYEKVFEELYGKEINFDDENSINKAYRKIALEVHPDTAYRNIALKDIPENAKEDADKATTIVKAVRDELIERYKIRLRNGTTYEIEQNKGEPILKEELRNILSEDGFIFK